MRLKIEPTENRPKMSAESAEVRARLPAMPIPPNAATTMSAIGSWTKKSRLNAATRMR